MSTRTKRYLEGVPTRPYDLLREGLTVLFVAALIATVLAGIFGAPDYPPVRSEDVAARQPIAFLKTSIRFLSGESGVDGYGPPYTNDRQDAQKIFGLAPANWFGVTNPIDPAEDFVLKPLARAAALSPALDQALATYRAASPSQQQAWVKNYQDVLEQATVQDGNFQLPEGDFGPVETMMSGMLQLGQGGLLEGALQSSDRLPYTVDLTRSLLFFQDEIDSSVASTLDMSGDQWGIAHETGAYPGSWWLWPYTFPYQVPALAASENADLIVGVIMILVFLILLFTPFIPIWNRIPRWLGVYKIIWRDWYKTHGTWMGLSEKTKE